MMEYEFHPWSEIFPLADGAHLTRLGEDIRHQGQHEPIVLYEGKILDGRNRYNACIVTGTEPKVVEYEGSEPLQWMVRKNIEERHLSRAQLAALGVAILNLRSGTRWTSQANSTRDNQAAAEIKGVADLVGASWSSIDRLIAIQKRRPELVQQVRKGEITISQASRAAGFVEYGDPDITVYFGKGDLFQESTEPLLRYLNGWRGRGFEFRHVNYREAQRRLKTIDRLMEGLTEARADLATRAVKTSLTH